MKTLVLADNNLKLDNRVKRHIGAMLDLGHNVTVLTSPAPDDEPGMSHAGLTMIFWPYPEITLQPQHLAKLAGTVGVTDLLFRAFPCLLARDLPDPRVIALSRLIQAKQMASSWWGPFAQPVCRDDIAESDDQSGVVAFFEYMLNWADAACKHEADVVYCNDLPSLLAGVAHKLRFGSRLIFDAHEIYYDMVPGAHTRLWKQSLALLELHLVQQADWVIGVSESHVDWMRRIYGRAENILCVPNCFGLGQEVEPPGRSKPPDTLRIYYHGASDPWRGLDQIVRALPEVPSVALTLRCFPSDHLEQVKQLGASLGVAGRMRFLPVVDSQSMITAIRAEADIGIHACAAPTAANIKVGLSNKFIEYLMAGVPIITSPLDEQARIVEEDRLGFVLSDNSPAEIKRGLMWMIENRTSIQEMGQRAYEAGMRRFNWPTIYTTLKHALVTKSH